MGPTSYTFTRKEVRPGKKMIRPPDCWDPPATSSHARKCLTVGTHLVEAYVALSFWSRTCTYIRSVYLQAAAMNCGHVRKGTCRSRGAHVSLTPTRAYVRPGLVYMAGSE